MDGDDRGAAQWARVPQVQPGEEEGNLRIIDWSSKKKDWSTKKKIKVSPFPSCISSKDCVSDQQLQLCHTRLHDIWNYIKLLIEVHFQPDHKEFNDCTFDPIIKDSTSDHCVPIHGTLGHSSPNHSTLGHSTPYRSTLGHSTPYHSTLGRSTNHSAHNPSA